MRVGEQVLVMVNMARRDVGQMKRAQPTGCDCQMKPLLIRCLIRVAVFAVSYFVVGIVVGRSFWNRIERGIDAEAFSNAVDLLGQQLGLAKITSLDTHQNAISQIVDYLTLPWALLGGACALLILESFFRIYERRRNRTIHDASRP
jgi:hypothetical protein